MKSFKISSGQYKHGELPYGEGWRSAEGFDSMATHLLLISMEERHNDDDIYSTQLFDDD